MMEIIVIGDGERYYAFSGDSLYVQNRLGDTLIPGIEGRWTFLEVCSSREEAKKLIDIWEEVRRG